MGSLRRWALSASRARVAAFSLANSSLRAASHSSCEATGGWAMFGVVMVRLPPCDSVLCDDSPHPITVVHPFQDFFFSIAIVGIPRHGHGGSAGLVTARTEGRG